MGHRDIILFLAPLILLMLRCIVGQATAGVTLSGSLKSNEGRLQTKFGHSVTFEFVCSELWSSENSLVVCRELGYPGLVRHYSSGSEEWFGPAPTGRPVTNLAAVSCLGNETQLSLCVHNYGVSVTCEPEATVSIVCQDIGYLGCFQQRYNEIYNGVPNAVRFVYAITDNDACIQGCEQGYDYAGISGSECICTFEEPSVELDPASDLDCKDVCETNKLQSCGQLATNQSMRYYTFVSTREGFCSELPPPENAVINGSSRFGQTVTFECDEEFSLVGERELRCVLSPNQDNSSELEWDGSPPACVEKVVMTTLMTPMSTTTERTATLGTLVSKTSVSITTEGDSESDNTPVDNKITILIAGLVAVSVCLVVLAIVFIACMVSKRKTRNEKPPETHIEMNVRPSQASAPTSNVYYSSVKSKPAEGDTGAAVEDDDDVPLAHEYHEGLVQHNYYSVRGQDDGAVVTCPRQLKMPVHESTSMDCLISKEAAGGGGGDVDDLYEDTDKQRVDVTERLEEGNPKKVALTVVSKTRSAPIQIKPNGQDAASGHEYAYIEHAQTPPFLDEGTPATISAGRPDSGDGSAKSPLSDVNEPLIPKRSPFSPAPRPDAAGHVAFSSTNQDSHHYLNDRVIYPRSRVLGQTSNDPK